MKREEIIEDLAILGDWIQTTINKTPPYSSLKNNDLSSVIEKEIYKNGWFEKESILQALEGIQGWLEPQILSDFSAPYSFHHFKRKLGLILAGNIPLVGFHDVLCGLLCGYQLQIKMSSEDQRLLPLLLQNLIERNPKYGHYIQLNPLKLQGFDAVIGTGSDSALMHFSSYFKSTPHLLRGNRTSIGILNGMESETELLELGKDIFQFFGRGCRNVTHLIVPEGYSFDAFFKAILPFQTIIQNKKYGNNYDYNRAIHMLSNQPILDNGFVVLLESKELHPPLAMLYFHYAKNPIETETYLQEHHHKIQCIVGKDGLPFGMAQKPGISDFADGLNTMDWLSNLRN